MIVDTVLKHSLTGKPLNDYNRDSIFEIEEAQLEVRQVVRLILLADYLANDLKRREPKTRPDQLEVIRDTVVWLFNHPDKALTYKGGTMTVRKFKTLSNKLAENYGKIFRQRSGFSSMKGSIPPALGVNSFVVEKLLDDWTRDPNGIDLEEYK